MDLAFPTPDFLGGHPKKRDKPKFYPSQHTREVPIEPKDIKGNRRNILQALQTETENITGKEGVSMKQHLKEAGDINYADILASFSYSDYLPANAYNIEFSENTPDIIKLYYQRKKYSHALLKSYDENSEAINYDKINKNRKLKDGVIAEAMLQYFLTYAEHMTTNTNEGKFFHNIPVPAIKDQKEKIDFSIQFDQQVHDGRIVHIQFTTNENALKHKQQQIDTLKNQGGKDILLVRFDFSKHISVFRQWLKDQKRNIKGPQFSQGEMKAILTDIFQQIYGNKKNMKAFRRNILPKLKPAIKSKPKLKYMNRRAV